MKKWKHTLLVSTLVLGSLPYNALVSPTKANATEVDEQITAQNQEVGELEQEQTEQLTEAGDTEKREKVITQQLTDSLEEELMNETEDTDEDKQNEAQVESIDQQVAEKADQSELSIAEQRMTPRNTGDFLVTLDGNLKPANSEYKFTNIKTLKFIRKEIGNEFSDEFQYEVKLKNGQIIVPRTIGDSLDFNNIVNFNSNIEDDEYFSQEGEYVVAMIGVNAQGYTDTGFFYNNIQRTASSVNIDGVINDPDNVVKDPESIHVGKDERDKHGESSFSWVITGKDLAGNEIKITGNDSDPDLSEMPPGKYTITNTVTEKIPTGYEGSDITHTTSGAFELSGGSAKVEYYKVDKDGNEILYQTDPPTYGRLNESYEKAAIDIPGYELIKERIPANKNGQYTEGEQIVRYYYKVVETKVKAEYVDEEGNKIAEGYEAKGEYGQQYTTPEKEILGYELEEVRGNASGTHGDKDQTVTYVYKKKETKVIVNYVDEKGNPLVDSDKIDGKFNDDYSTTPKDIPGYVVKVVPKNADGKHTVDPTEVTYVYEKVETNVNVEFVDEAGNPIADGQKISGKYEQEYTTKPVEIPGYDLVEEPENAKGSFTDQDQTVKYVYKKKKTKVTVNFVDENGKPLAGSKLQNGEYNDPYTTEPEQIPGYILVKVPGNASGNHTVDPTEVTYVYKKIEAPTVNDTLEGAKKVSGRGMPNSKVVVTFPNGATVTVDVDKDGNWQANVPEGVVLKKGDNVTAVTLDPKTGATSDSGKGAVTPIVSNLPATGDKGSVNKGATADPLNTTSKTKTIFTDPVNRSASSVKSTSSKLPDTGEEVGTYAVNLGIFTLILAFIGRMLKRREAE